MKMSKQPSSSLASQLNCPTSPKLSAIKTAADQPRLKVEQRTSTLEQKLKLQI